MLKRSLPTLTCLSFSLFASLFATSSFAASDLYVSPSGSDSNSGSQSAPFKTIAKASQAASPGTTIHVAGGTYNVSAPALGSAGILTSKSGTASAHIRFVSDPKNRAKIVMSGTGIAWNSTGSYVDIDGFEVTGSGRLGILAQGAHLSITNNYIHDLTASGGCNGSGGGGIDTPNTVGDVLIANNIVRNIGYSFINTCNTIQGIYIASPDNVVINNIASGTVVGIHQWHGATSSAIINNTVFHCKEGILIGEGDGGALPGGSENNYVANNIVYDNTTYGIIEYGKVGANNRYVNNLVYKSGTNVKMQTGSISGTISQDPMFVKYEIDGSGDYHLQPSSPAIGKGTLTSAPPSDLDGKSRGSTIDIGAYEYGGSAPAPSPSPTVTPKPSPSPTVTPKPSPSPTVTPKPSPSPTVTPKPSPSPSPAPKAPKISLSASSIYFGSVARRSVSSAKVLVVKNVGNAPLKFTAAIAYSSSKFSGSSSCSVSKPLAPGASCSVRLQFKPTAVGRVSGSMKISSNASRSPKVVTLVGRGK
ncbi:MAG: choice-of-anchor D domain-containing protein [Bdellovibrionia bacterium]